MGSCVAACGGSLSVKRVQPSGAGKQTAAEYAAATGLQVGDRLG